MVTAKHLCQLFSALFFGAGASTFIAWLWHDLVILNPFVSLLMVVVSPFFYMMSTKAKD